MEDLQQMLRVAAQRQTSLSQVVLTLDEFSHLTHSLSQIGHHLYEKIGQGRELQRELTKRGLELLRLEKENEQISTTMKFWKDNLLEGMELVKREVEEEAAINARWSNQLKKEQEVKAFLEASIKEYSEKYSSLSAETNVLRAAKIKLENEKAISQASFTRMEEYYKGKLDSKRKSLEQFESKLNQEKQEWEAQLRAREEKYNSEVKILKNQIQDKEAEIKRLNVETEELKHGIMSLKEELNEAQIQIQQAKQTKKESKDKAKGSKDKEKQNELLEEIKVLKSELKKQEESHYEAIKKIEADYGEEMERLQGIISELEVDLTDAKSVNIPEVQVSSDVEELKDQLELCKKIFKAGLKSKNQIRFIADLFEVEPSFLDNRKPKYSNYLSLLGLDTTKRNRSEELQKPEEVIVQPPEPILKVSKRTANRTKKMDIEAPKAEVEFKPRSKQEQPADLSLDRIGSRRQMESEPGDTDIKFSYCRHPEPVDGCDKCFIRKLEVGGNVEVKSILKKSGQGRIK